MLTTELQAAYNAAVLANAARAALTAASATYYAAHAACRAAERAAYITDLAVRRAALTA